MAVGRVQVTVIGILLSIKGYRGEARAGAASSSAMELQGNDTWLLDDIIHLGKLTSQQLTLVLISTDHIMLRSLLGNLHQMGQQLRPVLAGFQ